MTTKEKTLLEAFKLFIAKGYKGVSLNDIVAKVGITKGGFYHYFKSKEEVYFNTLETFFFTKAQQIEKDIFSPSVSAKEKLIKYLDFAELLINDETLSQIEDYKSYYLFVADGISLFPEVDQKVREFYDRIINSLANVIEDAKKDGKIKSDIDSHAISFQINAVFEGAVLLWAFNPNIDILKEIQGIKKSILRFLFEEV
jgi:AcrR family transcriptional regulator